jgi:uncharacterized membrane protein
VMLLLQRFGAWPLVGFVACVAVARVVFARALSRRLPAGLSVAILAVAGGVVLASLYDAAIAVRLYPVFMSAAMLAVFAHSLWRSPSMIERFARIVEPDLPPAGVAYTRNVTWVWCGFFALNGAVALWTALWADLAVWTLYNGAISYGLVGALAGGEWLLRGFIRGKERSARA